MAERSVFTGRESGRQARVFSAGSLLILTPVFTHQLSWSLFLASFAIAISVAFFWARGARVTIALMLLTVPYALGTYYGTSASLIRYPYPTMDLAESFAREQIVGITIAAAVLMVSGVASRFELHLTQGIRALQEQTGSSKSGGLLVGVAWILGLHDLLVVATNSELVFGDGRHGASSLMWVASGPMGIVAALALSLLLLELWFRGSRTASIIAFCVMWTPSLLSGARNYFSVVAVMFIIVAMVIAKTQRVKLLIVAGAAIGVATFVALPTIWSTNDLVGLNEWIMPNSIPLAVYGGVIAVEDLRGGGFLEQAWTLLPDFLRPVGVTNIADGFARLEVTNVPVGGSPWVEAFAEGQVTRVALFSCSVLALFALAVVATRVAPEAPLLLAGLVAFWGRSLVWNTVFTLVYCAFLLRVYRLAANEARGAKLEAGSRSAPSGHREHRG